MSKKKDSTTSDGVRTDDLIVAFWDERVLEAVGNVFENKLQSLVSEISALKGDSDKAN